MHRVRFHKDAMYSQSQKFTGHELLDKCEVLFR